MQKYSQRFSLLRREFWDRGYLASNNVFSNFVSRFKKLNDGEVFFQYIHSPAATDLIEVSTKKSYLYVYLLYVVIQI